jgi:hypothetical protein
LWPTRPGEAIRNGTTRTSYGLPAVLAFWMNTRSDVVPPAPEKPTWVPLLS